MTLCPLLPLPHPPKHSPTYLLFPLSLIYTQSWAAWREDQKPHLIAENHVAPQLSVRTVAIEGVDKEGRTCVLLKTRNHTPGQFPFEDMLKFMIYVHET